MQDSHGFPLRRPTRTNGSCLGLHQLDLSRNLGNISGKDYADVPWVVGSRKKNHIVRLSQLKERKSKKQRLSPKIKITIKVSNMYIYIYVYIMGNKQSTVKKHVYGRHR